MPTAEVNGTTLYYEDTGHGPPMVFIHGMCGDARVWADQMDRMAPRFRCIAYDRRGHTRSPLGNDVTRTVGRHADDAAVLIEQLAIAPCILVGSSGGARVAFDVVRRYPLLVRGAVLSEPPLLALDPQGADEFIGALKPRMAQAVAESGPKAGVDAFFEVACPGLWKEIPESTRDHYRANHVELFGDLQMPPYPVSREDLAGIRRPCLVIRGSDSHPALRNVARILADNIPGCQCVELKNCGHVTYYERPAEFAGAVTTFAMGLPRTSA